MELKYLNSCGNPNLAEGNVKNEPQCYDNNWPETELTIDSLIIVEYSCNC